MYLSYYDASVFIDPIPRLYSSLAIISLFYFYVDAVSAQGTTEEKVHRPFNRNQSSPRLRVCGLHCLTSIAHTDGPIDHLGLRLSAPTRLAGQSHRYRDHNFATV